ncbi:formate C-acetyltransferase/glycerol dehydratase family glycyl radical enzyme [Loigolactobacillus backii]|uniref:glycyl radical protein n=1 Tax=Loigolactobacillus backii TaxID=375175 RepID=UPI0007F15C27|nr:glycyl radical protein [Loigolactobacillus backii]ANK58892.1 glycyl radical enzyme [Loigolactobacillus backii]ANK63882.1 glycyl radical enzyme [Loigolactobacillus backii]ANK66329.1 glycyl radical enzyme [Loigolactobacillus backii]OLF69319.1 formate acetyltransferase [Loigolactobacillus backii]PIO84138.1 formate C-acetyltransferase/glycerol dehydratase family glycyl radical enzyme [Loigolactobacillus backii]
MQTLKTQKHTEEQTSHFGRLTPRMAHYRETIIDAKPYIDAERAILTTQAYKEHQHEQVDLLRAYTLENILKNMTLYIEDDTLLAGNQARQNRWAPIFPEYSMNWVIDELDSFEKRPGDVFYITDKTKQELKAIAPFWKNNTLEDRGYAAFPPQSRLFYDLGVIGADGNITSGDGHIAVDYKNVINKGLKWYEERVQAQLNQLDLTDIEQQKQLYFYQASLKTIQAVKDFAQRYAELAQTKAQETNDKKRQAELLEMARILTKVPYEPATSFHEALQAVWLVHLVLQIESNGHSVSYGRLDQYLDPFYEKDLQAGIIDKEHATELLTNLCLKTLTINKARSWNHTQFSAGSPLYQNITIGGQTPDGKDAVNPTSYLILRAISQAHLPQPNLTVRYHKGLSNEFMLECVAVIKQGLGMPAFNNDEVIIPSFIRRGVKKEDAYNYSAIGCVETAVPGKWGYRCTGMSFINFPRTLLIVMNGGVDPESKKRLLPDYGKFTEMTSYDQLSKAWDKALREMTRQSVIIENSCDLALEQGYPDILCSTLTDDCIGRGKTIKEGGAIYDFISGLQVGIANLADSLAAIKKLVFEEHKLTPAELWHALQTNFAGEAGEKVRQLLLTDAPKYGNDDDYVDQLIVAAYQPYIDEIAKYHNTRFGRGPIGGLRYAGTSSISANVGQGHSTLATPDGRYARTPLAEGCSPEHSMDTEGPTAVFKSVSKLQTEDITGGVLLNQKMSPQILRSTANCQKLVSLLRAYFNRLHGYHVQYNIVSRDTLVAAQKQPEKHRDLIVRVAGYSAFFVGLSKETQDDIIERTEQSL